MTDTPPADSGPKHPEEQTAFLADVVSFLRRNFLLILIPPFCFAAVAAYFVLTSGGRSYEASAILVIVPPKLSTDPNPQSLTALGYQTILESDAIIAETARRLDAKGLLQPGSNSKILDLHSEIFQTNRWDSSATAPMIKAIASGSSAAEAAAIVNTWTEVFVDRVHEIMAGNTSATVQFIDTQFPRSRSDLAQLEDQRTTAAGALQRQENEVAGRWDVQLAAFSRDTDTLLLTAEKESLDLVAAYNQGTRQAAETYQNGTQRLLGEFKVDRKLDIRRAELAANQAALKDFQAELAGLDSELENKTTQLLSTRDQIAATPRYNSVRKTVTDDVLWQSIARENSPESGLKDFQNKSLVAEAINPVWEALNSRLADLEIRVNTLKSRREQLLSRITETEKLVTGLGAASTLIERELAELERSRGNGLAGINEERAVGLTKLQDERKLTVANLKRDRDTQFAALTRTSKEEIDSAARLRQMQLDRLGRELTQQRDFIEQLGKTFNAASLAKIVQNTEDVRIGTPAVPPDRPLPRGGTRTTLFAFILGGCVGLGLAALREIFRLSREAK